MTIHRVGPQSDTTPKRLALGHVLVTIDDLDQLISLLERTDLGAPPIDVMIEFDGGYFTDASELVHLSDDEVKSLRVRSNYVQVNLDPTQAVAIGDEPVVEVVYRNWARSRQTKEKPDVKRHNVALTTFLVFIVCASIGFIIYQVSPPEFQTISPVSLGVAGFALLATTFNFVSTRNFRRSTSYAVVKPMTLHDYRQSVTANPNPHRANIIATVAVIVAVISVIASVLTAVLAAK